MVYMIIIRKNIDKNKIIKKYNINHLKHLHIAQKFEKSLLNGLKTLSKLYYIHKEKIIKLTFILTVTFSHRHYKISIPKPFQFITQTPPSTKIVKENTKQ